jgi:hypothetical protein
MLTNSLSKSLGLLTIFASFSLSGMESRLDKGKEKIDDDIIVSADLIQPSTFQSPKDRLWNHENHIHGKMLLKLTEHENKALLESLGKESDLLTVRIHDAYDQEGISSPLASKLHLREDKLEILMERAEDMQGIISDINNGTYTHLYEAVRKISNEHTLMVEHSDREDDDFMPAPKNITTWEKCKEGIAFSVPIAVSTALLIEGGRDVLNSKSFHAYTALALRALANKTSAAADQATALVVQDIKEDAAKYISTVIVPAAKTLFEQMVKQSSTLK